MDWATCVVIHTCTYGPTNPWEGRLFCSAVRLKDKFCDSKLFCRDVSLYFILLLYPLVHGGWWTCRCDKPSVIWPYLDGKHYRLWI